MAWNTDIDDLAAAIREFEAALPGFWWTIGQCSVSGDASCGVDRSGEQMHLLDDIPPDHPFDTGFHLDLRDGSPADALRGVMRLALARIRNANRVRK